MDELYGVPIIITIKIQNDNHIKIASIGANKKSGEVIVETFHIIERILTS